MTPCKTRMLRVCLLLLAAVPAYCQRGTIGIDVGQTADKFGGLKRSTGTVAGIDGEVIVLQSSDKDHGADVLAGGEVRFPVDIANHAKEYALYGGVKFRFTPNFSAGFHIQVHRIYLPPSTLNGGFFNRDRLSVVETPGFLEYKFGGVKHAFLRAEGGPEYTPHFHQIVPSNLNNPTFDYGYAVRGTVGYVFGKWYLKGTYETRYFKFHPDPGNPGNLYNWRSDSVTGGVGFAF